MRGCVPALRSRSWALPARAVSGIVFQDAVVDRALTGRQNLCTHAALWGMDAGAAREIDHAEMRDCAIARRRMGKLVGMSLGVGHQLGDGVERRLRIGDQHQRRVIDQADRREVLQGVVADIGVEMRVRHQGCERRHMKAAGS